MHVIRGELAARAIASPNGNKTWNSNTMNKILSDTTYTGRHPLGVKTQAIIDDEVFERAQRLRASNKHLHPPRKDPWPLQGRFKCAICGSLLQCEYSRNYRYYRCPGRVTTSKYYLENGKRCPMTGLRAEVVEKELLASICDAMLNPNNFAEALERTIEELRSTVAGLEQDTAPLEQALLEVNEELKRIERSWIKGRLSDEELREMERDAEARREHIQVRLDALDTDDLEELDKTRELIRAAEESLKMAKAVEGSWWSHGQAPPMWFTDVLIPQGWPTGEFVGDAATEGTVYDTFPPIDPSYTARTLTEALNRLQAEVWVKPGEMQLKGIVDINVPSTDDTPRPGVMLAAGGYGDSHALDHPSTGSP